MDSGPVSLQIGTTHGTLIGPKSRISRPEGRGVSGVLLGRPECRPGGGEGHRAWFLINQNKLSPKSAALDRSIWRQLLEAASGLYVSS